MVRIPLNGPTPAPFSSVKTTHARETKEVTATCIDTYGEILRASPLK